MKIRKATRCDIRYFTQAVLLLLSLLFLLSACNKNAENPVVEIDPTVGSPIENEETVKLYFSSVDYTYLLGEDRTVNTSKNQLDEYVILSELIQGPKLNTLDFKPLINPNTQIINISESQGVLTVILSNDFLDWGFLPSDYAQGEQEQVKQMAIYSIVNTLVEGCGHARIQLLVDREGSKTGQRIQLDEVGMGSNGVLEPLGRSGERVYTSMRVVESIFDGLRGEDYGSIYAQVADEDENGEQSSDQATFIAGLQERSIVLEEYTIEEVLEPTNSNYSMVMVSYTLRLSGKTKEYENVPVQLVKTDGLWKITESNLKELLQ